MKQCILHIGMPKTGTSSIQQSLCHGLSDPAYRYIGLGMSNSGPALVTLFGNSPENHHLHRKLGRTAQQVQQYRAMWLNQLDNILAQTDSDIRPVLSAEVCWGLDQGTFVRIRDFMAARDYSVRIIAYLRPWKQWLESSFQQQIKSGLSVFRIFPANALKIDYQERIETLEAVFGADQVQVYKYDPGTFSDGCVVRHFCQQVGIDMDPAQIRRANDSLALPAVQLLYAYRKYGPGYGTGAAALAENGWLIDRLHEVEGPTLRIHSSVIEPMIGNLLPQASWLERRLGVPFAEEMTRYDSGVCIRAESDLFAFDPAALTWLAAAAHSKAIRPAAGEEVARAVAAQMHRLRQLCPGMPARVKSRRLIRTIGQRLRRWQGRSR